MTDSYSFQVPKVGNSEKRYNTCNTLKYSLVFGIRSRIYYGELVCFIGISLRKSGPSVTMG